MVIKWKGYSILKGPTRDELIDKWKYAFNADAVIPITDFTLEKDYVLSTVNARIITVTTLGYEDDSDDNKLSIKGCCEIPSIKCFEPNALETSFKFEASYDEKKRKGHIWVLIPY